jgi:23S rRNA (adenine1618-N6)-methyltransferase
MTTAKPFRYPNYNKPLDFHEIALKDEDFSEILRSNGGSFDWQKPDHLLQLTKSILKRDFGLKLKLPSDRLCPPVSPSF